MITIETHRKKIRKTHLKRLAKFVVVQNFVHHLNMTTSNTYQKDILSLYDEELAYLNSADIFIAKNEIKAIVGSIRVLKWNYVDALPIEKIFAINPLNIEESITANDIYHIGRFAIRKDTRDLNLLKRLLVLAIEPVCSHSSNIAFAECDSKLLRVLTLLGIKIKIIGNSVNYLGSETIPILMTVDGLLDFYYENMELIRRVPDYELVPDYLLHKSLVNNKQACNYNIV